MTMRGVIISGGATVMLGAVAVPASAQDQTPRLDISVGMSVRHDSNIARSSRELAAARGVDRADQRATPSISIDALQFFGPHSASLSGSVGYDFYRKNTQLNRERLSLDAQTRWAFRPCDVDLSASFSRQQSQLGFSNLLLSDPEAAIDNTENLVEVGADITCGEDIGLRPTFGISRVEGDNSNILRKRSDFGTTTYSSGLGYRHPSIGLVQVTASRRETEFPNTQLPFTQSDFVARNAAISFERDIGARWTARAEVGFTNVDSSSIAGGNFEGLTYGLDLTGRISPRFSLGANVSRRAQTSLNDNAAYSVDSSYGLTGSYQINPFVSARAGYQYSRQRYFYDNNTANLFGPLIERERRHSLSGSVTYRRSPRLGLSLDAGYDKRNTNQSFFDYDGYYVGLSVNSTF